MSERGIFAMDRGWFDHPTFATEPYTEREAWAWLISAAAYKPHQRRVGNVIIPLRRGQLAASIRFLGEKWQWHRSKVARFIDRLSVHDMVETDARQGINLITIRNYNKYQKAMLPTEQQSETAARQQRDKLEPLENKEDRGGGDDARDHLQLLPEEAVRIANEAAVLVGHDLEFPPSGWCGAALTVSKWLREGWTHDIIFAGIRGAMAKKRDGPPHSINYFEKAIARLVAEQSTPLPIVVIPPGEVINGGGNGQSWGSAGPLEARAAALRRAATQ